MIRKKVFRFSAKYQKKLFVFIFCHFISFLLDIWFFVRQDFQTLPKILTASRKVARFFVEILNNVVTKKHARRSSSSSSRSSKRSRKEKLRKMYEDYQLATFKSFSWSRNDVIGAGATSLVYKAICQVYKRWSLANRNFIYVDHSILFFT